MVRITSDSTADLEYLFEQYDIKVMPLLVQIEGIQYEDGVTVQPQKIFDTYEEKKILPKTAARGIDEYIDFFNKYKDGGEIVHFCVSGEMSSSYNNALRAAEEVGGVYVVDSRSLSTGIGLLVLKAYDLAKEGLNAATIFDRITELIPHVQASFVVDNLEYLHKGGRCSGVAKFFSSVLAIKPIILVKNGSMVTGQKFVGKRFNKCVTEYVKSTLRTYDTPDYRRIFITHTYADPEIVDSVREQIKEIAPQFEEVLETHAGCTITSHCGKNTLGILYINKNI